MLKCSVKIDENLQKEINKKMWITSLILTIVGSIGLGLYIILGSFFEHVLLELLLWVTAFMFGFGLTFLITINKTNAKAASNGLIDEIELFEEYSNITTIKNEEVIATAKIYHKDLIKIKETENYLVLYVNKASAIAIPKKQFNPQDYSTIKLWVNQAKLKNTSKS